jgi:hypothetical protein
MFNLTNRDLGGRILSCADGPAAFNATMSKRGLRVVSCDPLYQFSPEQIRKRIDETYATIMEQTYHNTDRFLWTRIQSVEHLGQVRRAAMEEFLEDYDLGRAEGRYVIAELPDLPFTTGSFDLALCSHFLFLYSPILTRSFHIEAVEAMCRVAREVRIFPLLTYNSESSPDVEQVMEMARSTNRKAEIQRVAYEFQRGGNEMLRILSNA